jgi:hypothetical protein
MYKQLIAACMVIAGLAAFVAVPVASASPVLTNGGVAVLPGTEVTGKNTGVIKFTSAFTVECTSADFTLKVTANSGTSIKGEIEKGKFTFSGTGAGGDCTSSQGAFTTAWSKLCLETVAGTDNVKVTGCGANATFTTTFTGGLVCKYSTASFTGTFVTNSDATLNFASQKFSREEGLACPVETQLDMDFDLTTTAGGTLLIS